MSKSVKTTLLLISFLILAFAVAGAVGAKAGAADDGAYRQLSVYSEVLARIRSDYVEEPNIGKVSNGALHGLLEALDSNSSYLNAEEYRRYKEMGPSEAGIGASVSKRYGYGNVVSVIPGGPADKAGLVAGDVVEALNGRSTHDVSLAMLKSLLAGKAGTTVELSVVRPNQAQPKKITIERAVVTYAAPELKMLEDEIGYLHIEDFPAGRSTQVAEKIRELEERGAKQLILDLRNSGGGELKEGIDTAKLFLDRGAIAYAQGQTYPRQEFKAEAGQNICSLPLVVIVNRSTAGPAEVVAGAILDNKRGDVLGEKTFGSGSVLKTIPLDDGGALILSIAKYHTPSGTAIEDDGITPSVTVAEKNESMLPPGEMDEDELMPGEPEVSETPKEGPKEKQPDEQLRRAIEQLKKSKPEAAAAPAA